MSPYFRNRTYQDNFRSNDNFYSGRGRGRSRGRPFRRQDSQFDRRHSRSYSRSLSRILFDHGFNEQQIQKIFHLREPNRQQNGRRNICTQFAKLYKHHDNWKFLPKTLERSLHNFVNSINLPNSSDNFRNDLDDISNDYAKKLSSTVQKHCQTQMDSILKQLSAVSLDELHRLQGETSSNLCDRFDESLLDKIFAVVDKSWQENRSPKPQSSPIVVDSPTHKYPAPPPPPLPPRRWETSKRPASGSSISPDSKLVRTDAPSELDHQPTPTVVSNFNDIASWKLDVPESAKILVIGDENLHAYKPIEGWCVRGFEKAKLSNISSILSKTLLPSSVKQVIVAAGAYNADCEPDRCFSQLSELRSMFPPDFKPKLYFSEIRISPITSEIRRECVDKMNEHALKLFPKSFIKLKQELSFITDFKLGIASSKSIFNSFQLALN